MWLKKHDTWTLRCNAVSIRSKNCNNNSVGESTFLEIFFCKICPEGKICDKFLKKAKTYFIEGRF